MVCCVHRKRQTRAGVSGDFNKQFECVTITDSKFSNRVLTWVTPEITSINWVTIWLEQLDFCLHRCKWEIPDHAYCQLHFPFWIVLQYPYHLERNSSTKLSSSSPSLTLVVLYTKSLDSAYARHTSKSVEEQLPWVLVTPYHQHNSVNLPTHLLYIAPYTCCLEVMV